MSVLAFSGYETGDLSEFPTTTGTHSVQTTTVNPGGGKYALNTSTLANYTLFNFTAAATSYCRFYVRLHALSNSILANQFTVFETGVVGVQDTVVIFATTDSNGNPSLGLYNSPGAAILSGSYAVPLDTWLCVELQVVVSATIGQANLWVNNVSALTNTGLNTGANNTSQAGPHNFNNAGTGTPTGTIYWDDILVTTTGPVGYGTCKAWQFNATTPALNGWTKSTGTTINTCWDDTPFIAGIPNASTATAAAQQTGVANCASATDLGATNGPATIVNSDTINAVKVALIGKTSSTATDGADSTIFRNSAGTNTITAVAVYTVSDAYRETLLAGITGTNLTPTCQAGVQKGTGTKTHTVEDVWLMVDFTQLRYAIDILRRSHRLKNPPKQKFVKSSQPRIPKGSVQIPADALGIWPHLLNGRVQHTIKPSQKWRSVKSTFRRWSFIQPPAAKLGMWPHLLSSRIQRRLNLSKSKLRQDEQDVSRRAVAPTAIVFMRRLRGKLTKRTKRVSRLEVTAVSGRPIVTGLRPFVRRAKAITIVSRRKIRRSRLIATAPVAFRRAVAHLKTQPRKLRARLRLRVPIKLIQPPAAALGFSVTRIKSPHRTKAPSTLKARRGSQDVQRRIAAPGAMIRRARRLAVRIVARRPASRRRLRMPATVIFAMLFLRRLRRISPKLRSPKHKLGAGPLSGRPAVTGFRPFARRTKATIIITRRKVRQRLQTPLRLIQPPATALGATLREIVHKARPVQLSKPWRIVKSTFKKIWLAQPPAARLGFPPSKLADRHRLVLRPSSKLVKSVMRSPRRQIQPAAAALGMAVRSLVHKAHPVKLGKAWKTVKSSFKLGELQRPAAAALLAFVPIKLRKAHRLVLLKSSKLVKDTLHIPRVLIQPPAAKLGVALRNIIRKPRPLSFSRPFRLVKMRMRAPRDVIQPPAAKLGVWPHLLSSRIQHRVKPSLKWRIVKSAFKRWSFIQPPAVRLGVAVRKLVPKAKLLAPPKPWRTVKSLFKRPDKIIPPPIVAGANVFVPKVHSSKLRARAAAHTARRRLRLAAPAAFIRLRAIRRIRRATAQQRPVRRRLHFGAPLAFIRLHAIRRIRQLPARQVRHRLSARIAQAPAALFRLRHVHAARKAQRPTSAKAHRRIFSGPSSFIHFMRAHRRRPSARKPQLSRRRPRIGVLLGMPTVAELLGFLRVRPHGARALFKPFKWLRVSRWLRQWRFGPPPPPSAELPRIILNARLDSVVEFAATLNRDPIMADTSNQIVTIDARL